MTCCTNRVNPESEYCGLAPFQGACPGTDYDKNEEVIAPAWAEHPLSQQLKELPAPKEIKMGAITSLRFWPPNRWFAKQSAVLGVVGLQIFPFVRFHSRAWHSIISGCTHIARIKMHLFENLNGFLMDEPPFAIIENMTNLFANIRGDLIPRNNSQRSDSKR